VHRETKFRPPKIFGMVYPHYYYHRNIDFTENGISRMESERRATSDKVIEDIFTPQVMDVIHDVCSHYPLSRKEVKQAIRKAILYYKQRKGRKIIKREYIYAVAYLLLINKGFPIDIDEYVEFVKKCYSCVCPPALRKAIVELPTSNVIKVTPKRWVRVWRYIMNYLRNENLMKENILKEVRDIYVKVRYEFQHIHNRSSSIAGAILYIALNKAGVRTTLRELTKALKCSEWSIRCVKRSILENTRLIEW